MLNVEKKNKNEKEADRKKQLERIKGKRERTRIEKTTVK